jgi:hypothetical protein
MVETSQVYKLSTMLIRQSSRILSESGPTEEGILTNIALSENKEITIRLIVSCLSRKPIKS